MADHAILIANSVGYGDAGHPVPPALARTVAAELEARLEQLRNRSFRVTSILNTTAQEASARIKEAIKKASPKADLLLIFYFGHAVRPIESKEGLHLFFKDSNWLELPTMVDFADITKWLLAYKPRSVAVTLDCCYAGAVAPQLRILDDFGGKYFLMASVPHKGKAQVDYGDDQPIGRFSKYLLDAFTSPAARTPLSTHVTFQSFFDFAEGGVRSTSKQQPFAKDGGLGNQTFFEQSLDARVPSSLRHAAPKKSSYFKLHSLLITLHTQEFRTDHALYKHIEARTPKEFLTPVQIAKNLVEYRAIGEDAFDTYLYLARTLGLLRPAPPPRPTDLGHSMVSSGGAAFNSKLFEAVLRIWQSRGIDLQDLHNTIGQRLRNNGIPDVDSIYLDLYVTRSLRMSKELFKVMLDLTGYVGALRYTRRHTFFLPGVPGLSEAST